MLAPLSTAASRCPRTLRASTYDFSPASASAPAGSTIVRVSSKMSLIAAQISSLLTRMISSTRRLHDRERVLADLLHRHAVGEQPDVVQPHAAPGRERLRHRVGIHRLDADRPARPGCSALM